MRVQGLLVCFLASSVIIPVPVAADTRPATHTPRFVSWVLSGFRLNNDAWLGVKPYLHDVRTGYYFISAEDCFGMPRSYTLGTREMFADSISPSDLSAIPHGRLRLRIGNGVAIGNGRHEVEARLGPPQHQLMGPRGEQTDIYTFAFPKRWGTWGYQANYTFRHERLWAIKLERFWTPNNKNGLEGRARRVYTRKG